MQRLQLTFFISCLTFTMSQAQTISEKTLITESRTMLHPDSIRVKIYTLTEGITDTTSTATILNMVHSSEHPTSLTYVLFANDTTRYAAIVYTKRGIGNVEWVHPFMIWRFDSIGNYQSLCRYDDEGLAHKVFLEWYPGMIPKTSGNYKHGEKLGRWIHYNEEGKVVKVEKYGRRGLKHSRELKHPHYPWFTFFRPKYVSTPGYRIAPAGN